MELELENILNLSCRDMKKYLFLIFPIYFATRAILLGIEGNFGFGFVLRVILFFVSLYWAIQELKK